VLESDEVKVYKCAANSLIVDRFEREDVWPTSLDNPQFRDHYAILEQIRKDLFAILDNCQGDIASFLGECSNLGESKEGAALELSKYLRKARQVSAGDLADEMAKLAL